MPQAILSGGVDIPHAAWIRSGTSDVWSASLTSEAAAALSNSSAGSIFVAGVRRNIVRTPSLRWSKSLGAKGSTAAKQGFIVARGTLDPTWSLDAASVSLWRVAAFHSWTKAYHTVKSVDNASGTITFNEEAFFGYGEYEYCSGSRFYIEGVPELDLTPGSWRVIPAATSSSPAHLEYRPAAKEVFPPSSASQPVVVPVLPTLLRLYGVRDVTLANLTFENTAGGDCHADKNAKACDNDEGAVAHNAVVVGGADGVTLTSLTFRGIGGFALYASGTSGLVVQRVAALDCGSGGIFVRSCPAALINNTIVQGYGRRFAAASGLTMTGSRNGTISHCDVSGGIYSGLAGGGKDDSGAYSVFEFNHVHDNGSEDEDGLCDFGGYHGSTAGSVLPLYMHSNIFHSITAYANGGSGMYYLPRRTDTAIRSLHRTSYTCPRSGLFSCSTPPRAPSALAGTSTSRRRAGRSPTISCTM